ncbi:MAG: T9SS type A sorting domain-containing protein [Bacteroidetes bacterium]|nr:T9SS type A sorting domain-containing protein [Bacteroidota bacterium]MBS1630610.1 T9SS type A sorting domain-containing protein [Bacteroidota bacterium]
MKHIALIMCSSLLGMLPAARTQAQSWIWAQRHGGDSVEVSGRGIGGSIYSGDRVQGWNSVVDVTTDAQNNVYAVSLVLSKYLDLNGLPLSGWGRSDLMLSSYTCTGQLRWSKVIGSNLDSDLAVGVRCDDQGVYVGGMTNSNFALGSSGCHFGTDTVTGNTTKNIFLAKWDFNGQFQWLRMPQPDTLSAAMAQRSALVDLDATPSGDTCFMFCYLSPGSYGGGAYQVTTPGMNVLKYTSSGQFAGGVALPYQQPILSTLYLSSWRYNSPLRRFVVAGTAFNSVTTTLNMAGTQLGIFWGYLASFDAGSGHLNFLIYDTVIHGIVLSNKPAIDAWGNIYLSGSAQKDNHFNGVPFPNPIADTSNFVQYNYCPFVMKIDGQSGNPIWTAKAQATTGWGLNVCLRKKELLLTGVYRGTLSFPGHSISNNPLLDTNDAFIAYLDTASGGVGRLYSLKTKGYIAYSENIFNVIIADRKGSFICGGSFRDTLVLGQTTLVEQHPAQAPVHSANTKHSDAWIGKLGYDNCNCSISASYQTVGFYSNSGYFTYLGSTNLDSLVWEWGDGTQSTYRSNFLNTISHAYSGAGHYMVCVTAYVDSCIDSRYCQMQSLGMSQALGAAVEVYPNPATQALYIGHLAGGSVRILSVRGEEMIHQSIGSERQEIPIGSLAPGYYLVLLRDKEGQSGQRSFVKQ